VKTNPINGNNPETKLPGDDTAQKRAPMQQPLPIPIRENVTTQTTTNQPPQKNNHFPKKRDKNKQKPKINPKRYKPRKSL